MEASTADALNLAVADIGVQAVTRGGISLKRAGAVAGSSYITTMLGVKNWVRNILLSINPTFGEADSFLGDFLVNTLSTTIVLYGLDRFNIISEQDAQADMEGSRPSSSANFMKSMYLAGMDSLTAEILSKMEFQLFNPAAQPAV